MAFLKRIREWPLNMRLMVYVGDCVVSLRGPAGAIEYSHPWVTKMLLSWVERVLDMAVAANKLVIVASSRGVRKVLQEKLAPEGFVVQAEGELLGVGYAAGGRHRRRPAQQKRRQKARRRKGKIRWLRSLGGDARRVVKDGVIPSACHGCESTGIPLAMLRDMRYAQAGVAAVKCSGASITARLAVAGEGARDIDPAVLKCNPPMEWVASKLWDEPRARAGLVKAWLKAREEVLDGDGGQKWVAMRGPFGAAMLHMARMGAAWHKPFWVRVLGREVSILDTPPLQLMELLKEHARLELDRKFLRRIGEARGWCLEQVLDRYAHGIDWDILRKELKGQSVLKESEKAALRIVAAGGFWAEDRKWRAGLRPTGTCDECLIDIGTDFHCLHDCGGLVQPMLEARLMSRIGRMPKELREPAYAPLAQMALPPRALAWQPIEVELTEGACHQGHTGETFGDGSGYRQDCRELRVATWSIARIVRDETGWRREESTRGSVGGFFPTVPRGEIRAAIEHMKHAMVPAAYIGDCKHVIQILDEGIPDKWVSSRSFNADLWKEARRLMQDHGAGLTAEKVRAHRARRDAELEGDDALRHWCGNEAADRQAKSLAKSLMEADGRFDVMERMKLVAEAALRRTAVAAAWILKRRPNLRRRRIGIRDKGNDYEEKDHILHRRQGDGWECLRCRAYAVGPDGWKALRKRPCEGEIAGRAHPSHSMATCRGIEWCTRCACYAARWPRRLAQPCTGQPRSEAQRNVKRRLMAGLTPTTAGYLMRARCAAMGLAASALTTCSWWMRLSLNNINYLVAMSITIIISIGAVSK